MSRSLDEMHAEVLAALSTPMPNTEPHYEALSQESMRIGWNNLIRRARPDLIIPPT